MERINARGWRVVPESTSDLTLSDRPVFRRETASPPPNPPAPQPLIEYGGNADRSPANNRRHFIIGLITLLALLAGIIVGLVELFH